MLAIPLPPSAVSRASEVAEAPAGLVDDQQGRGEIPARRGVGAISIAPSATSMYGQKSPWPGCARTARPAPASNPTGGSRATPRGRRTTAAPRPARHPRHRHRAEDRADRPARRHRHPGPPTSAAPEPEPRRRPRAARPGPRAPAAWPTRDAAHVALGAVDRIDDPAPTVPAGGPIRRRTPRRRRHRRAAPRPGARGPPAPRPCPLRSPASRRAWSGPRGRERGSDQA